MACSPWGDPLGLRLAACEHSLRWYALRTKSRCEKMVATHLHGRGYEEFLPLYRSLERWTGRDESVDFPLFPGYVFCRFDAWRRLPILTTPGMVSIVGYGRIPSPVEEAEIEAIRAIMKSGLPASPWPYLKEGQWVRVSRGALKGLEGLVKRLKNRYRVVVSVSLLERSVAVEVDRDSVVPITGPRTRNGHFKTQVPNGQLPIV